MGPPLLQADVLTLQLGERLQGGTVISTLQERPQRSLSRKSPGHRTSLGNLWLGADQGSDSTARPNEQP